jgi:general secretion pathway protein G
MQSRRFNRRARRGFSLLEMMLVVVIIGILMSVVIVNLAGTTDKVKIQTTKAKMQQVQQAMAVYSAESGSYPPTEMGLQPLVTTKAIKAVPTDGWKRPLRYMFPGTSNDPDRPYDLVSAGMDGIFDSPDDINIWTMDTP